MFQLAPWINRPAAFGDLETASAIGSGNEACAASRSAVTAEKFLRTVER